MKEDINIEERPSLRDKPSPRERGLSKERVKFLARIAMMAMFAMLVLPIFLGLFMPTASAVMGEEYAVQNENGQVLAIIGFVGLVFIAILQWGLSLDVVYNPVGGLATVILAMILIIPLTLGGIVMFEGPELTFCEQNPSHPDCLIIPPEGIRWMIDLDPDGDVDGSTYPAGQFTDVDTAVRGTTGEWETANDNPLVNDVTHEITASIHQDTDLNWDDAAGLWIQPKAIFIEAALVKLLDGPKSAAGAIVVQQYWGRIDSIQYIVPGNTDNESGDPVDPIWIDGYQRHHIGWQDETTNWLEACPEYRGMPLPAGASCDPIPLGTDDTAGDAIKAVASGGIRIFWIWADRGPFNWYAQDGASWSLTFSIGSEGDWHTWTFHGNFLEDATNNT